MSLFDHAAELARRHAQAVLLEREARMFRRDMQQPVERREDPEPQIDWRAEVERINEGRSTKC